MKKQLILTQQQQQLVEDNHKLIYFYLYRNSLSVDEFYDVAAIGLCKAAITYNGQTKFSTYAYACIKCEIFNEMHRQKSTRKIPKDKQLSYDEKTKEGYGEEKWSYLSDNKHFEDTVELKMLVESYINKLKIGRNKIVLKLYCKGYSGTDIVKITGVNRTTVGKQIADMKKYLQSV